MKCKFYALLFAFVASISFSQAAIIEVDGDFSDWDAVPAERLAQASTDEHALLKDLYTIKFCMDANNVYFYLEFNGDTYVHDDQQLSHVVESFDIFFSVDDDVTTGFYNPKWGWENSGSDYLVEGLLDGGFGAFHYQNEWGDQSDWSWSWISDSNITTSESILLANSHKAFEGKIEKSIFQTEIVNLKVGVFTNDLGWNENGCLPQMSVIDNDSILSGMLIVPPASQPITKDYIVTYVSDNIDLDSENVTLHLPAVPEIEGFTFLKWIVVASDLEDGIIIQATYTADDPDSAPAVVVNPANKTQKLIREGNVFILTDTKTYTIQGQEVK